MVRSLAAATPVKHLSHQRVSIRLLLGSKCHLWDLISQDRLNYQSLTHSLRSASSMRLCGCSLITKRGRRGFSFDQRRLTL